MDKRENKRKVYTQEQKINAITVLKDNDYNYRKTSDETGISQLCLRQWKHKYSDMLTDQSRISVYQAKAEEKIIQKKIGLLEDHLGGLGELTEETIDKIRRLIPTASVTEAVSVLRALTEVYRTLGIKDQTNNEQSVSIISQVINQQVNVNKE